MKQKKSNALSVLLDYAGSHKRLTFLGLTLSAVSMLMSMAPYICIWLVARDLIAVAPNWMQAQSIARYGWMAFGFAVGGILLYFAGLMCTHLAAFRTASNIRKRGIAHVLRAPLGFFDSNASGLIRNRLDAAAAETETLLAHNLADIVGTITLFLSMIVLMFVFDWRMGAACLLAAVISILAMFSMMGGKNAGIMAEYQAAQDRMSKAGTEYVRGIPVVKVFQQTVDSFKAFKQAIEEYLSLIHIWAGQVGYAGVLIPTIALFSSFGPVVALAALGSTLQNTFAAGNRVLDILDEQPVAPDIERQEPISFDGAAARHVHFAYGEETILDNVSVDIPKNAVVGITGRSGSGKSTLLKLLMRFWRVQSGEVSLSGRNIERVNTRDLRDMESFVTQETQLFHDSIRNNLRLAKLDATDAEIEAACRKASVHDFIMTLPRGYDTPVGELGDTLSGGERQRLGLALSLIHIYVPGDTPFTERNALANLLLLS